MRPILLAAFLFLCNIGGFSQNATLTKGETVAYIEKKFRELEDTYVYLFDTTGRTTNIDDKKLTGMTVRLIDDKLYVNYTLSFRGYINPGCFCSYEFSFKPANIMYTNYSSEFQNFLIDLSNATGRTKQNCCQYHTNLNKDDMGKFVVLHIKGDADYINKITKALYHLRDLLKAEDDPFK